MIPGYFDPNVAHPWPRVRVGILVTDITRDWAVVEFVLDTGASATCLHPADALGVPGIDLTMLTDPTRWGAVETFTGIGGGVRYFTTPVRYGLFRANGQVHFLDGTINVAQWTMTNQTLPSLLGWDVLEKFRLYADPSVGRLELTPIQSP